MGLLQKALLVLILCGSLFSQNASVTYSGQGCGWFANPVQDLRVTNPILGQTLVVYTSIPVYGIDYLAWGRLNPNWPFPQPPVNGRICRLHSWWVPYVYTQYLFPVGSHQFFIPNDSGLIGARVYLQQLNWSQYPSKWESSRVAKLTLGQ